MMKKEADALPESLLTWARPESDRERAKLDCGCLPANEARAAQGWPQIVDGVTGDRRLSTHILYSATSQVYALGR